MLEVQGLRTLPLTSKDSMPIAEAIPVAAPEGFFAFIKGKLTKGAAAGLLMSAVPFPEEVDHVSIGHGSQRRLKGVLSIVESYGNRQDFIHFSLVGKVNEYEF